MPTLAELRAMPHTSISALKTYLSCPRKYFFQYVEKAIPEWRPLPLVFGTAFHATFTEYFFWWGRGRVIPRDEIHEHLRNGITRGIHADGPPVLFEEEAQDEGSVIDLALRMFDTLVERAPRPDIVHGVEVPFCLGLVHPLTGEVNDVPLVGALDALVEEEGHSSVWELKTSKKKWGTGQLEFDPQATAYTMAARALGYDAEVRLIVATKAKTPDVQVERLRRSARSESELVDVASSVQRAVRAGVAHPVRDWQCKSCPYAHACGS
jgi:CRISPR/Cas system-associated exonuclease Cas4 (RecB family)